MKQTLKKLLAFVLVLAMVCGVLPTFVFAAEEEASTEVVTPEAEAALEADIFSDIDAYFENSAKRAEERTLADYVAATDDIAALVKASDTYLEGSYVERGDGFFWQTTEGITCGYFPKERYDADNRTASTTRNATASNLTSFNYSAATSADVCLVGPMYSEDSSFTDQYANEAASIADATGGTAYKLINSSATVTAIAQAMEKCGVIIFDSHGNTDWGYFDGGSDGTGNADCTSQANTSYLCLSSGSGITSADMAYVTGTYGTYCHAYSDTSGNYVIDGTAVANHMSSNSSGGVLWMAICLGMATDGFCTPMLNKGLDVVYGYSQSVSFTGDYKYEEYFWDSMIAGNTVATAISGMKNSLGKWDPAYSSYSFTNAVKNYCAFPIVASTQDTYPGQGKVDAYQTVNSTWKLADLTTPPTPITLTLNNNGVITTLTDTTFTLPTCEAPTGYSFLGWTTAAITTESTGKPSTCYAGGSTFRNMEDITLYALYSRLDSSTGSGTGEWTLMTDASTLTAGTQLVFASNTKGMVAAGMNGTYLTNSATTFASDYSTLTLPSDGLVLTLGGTSGAWTFANSEGALLGASAAKKLAWDNGTTTWDISLSGSDATILNGTSNNGKILYNASSPRFTTYTSNTSATMLLPQIYYLDGTAGTTYYTTAPSTCEHNWVAGTVVAPTCTVGGYTPYTCSLCGNSKQDNLTDALGHDYGSYVYAGDNWHTRTCSRCNDEDTTVCTCIGVTTPPTETDGGYTTYTCTGCGNVYTADETPALGSPITVSFSVPTGVTAVASMTAYANQTITLPSVTGTPDTDDVTPVFVGWASASVDNSTTKPTVYAAGSEYTVTAAATLYAVYSYVVSDSGSTSSEYTLVTDASALISGSSVVIAASGYDYAISTTQERNNRPQAAVTKNATDSTLSFTASAGVCELILGAGQSANTWSFYDAANEGYLYAASSSSNYLRTEAELSANSSWKIVVASDGTATITAQGSNSHNLLKYNNNSSIFSCYASGQKDVALYQKGSSTTYYTTQFTPACVHNWVAGTPVAATCTTDGYTPYT